MSAGTFSEVVATGLSCQSRVSEEHLPSLIYQLLLLSSRGLTPMFWHQGPQCARLHCVRTPDMSPNIELVSQDVVSKCSERSRTSWASSMAEIALHKPRTA